MAWGPGGSGGLARGVWGGLEGLRGVQGWVPRGRRGLWVWGCTGQGRRGPVPGVWGSVGWLPGSGGLRVWGLRGLGGRAPRGRWGLWGLRPAGLPGGLPRARPAGVAPGRCCPWPAWKDFVAGRGAVCLASRFALEPHCGLFVLNSMK